MNNPKDFKKVKFLHLVDHNGTISGLICRLSVFPEHYVITSFPRISQNKIKIIEKLSKNTNIKCILHATGSKKYFYSLKDSLAKQFNHLYIFLHVAPKHFLIKGRLNELQSIKNLVKTNNVKILIPSKELIKEYSCYGLKTIPIQLGAAFDKKSIKNSSVNKKYILSVCTAKEPIYHYIKGIDQFSKLIHDLNLNKYAIILGNRNKSFEGIKTKKVSQDNFLKYLSQSKVYIQLSRTESYNLSAVSAKRLKIPIIVSNIEGHKDNIKYGFRVNTLNEAKKALKYILSNPKSPKLKTILENNYKDSIKRETLNNFRNSFNKFKK